MAKTRMSSKGQVVIPKDVREAARWTPGVELDVIETDDGVLLRRAGRFATTALEDVVGCTGYEGRRISLEEMERAVEEEAKARM